MLAAQCQGVSPALLLAFTLAPRLSSASQPSAHPSYAALCRGVFPAASTSFTSAPAARAALIAAVKGELTCVSARLGSRPAVWRG